MAGMQRYWIGFRRTDDLEGLPDFPLYVRASRSSGVPSYAASIEALDPDAAWAAITSAFPGAVQLFLVSRGDVDRPFMTSAVSESYGYDIVRPGSLNG